MSLMLAMVAAAAAAPEVPPICTDRPAKANAVCTVPRGKVQLETSAAGWSLTKVDGVKTKVLMVASSFVKVGLSERSDLQVGVTPYARFTVEHGEERDHHSGIGDLLLRYKHRLTSRDAKVQAGVIPFVKLPTASHGVGNGTVEGGLAVPVSFVGPVTITIGPEADVLADTDGHGRHVAIVNLINIAGTLAPRLTLSGEVWSNFNFDPAGTVRQASVDAALAFAVSNDLQLDAGTNFGLTRDTADVEVYAGASIRF